MARLPLSAVSLADGAPLSELSWSSSLSVVAVSFSGLFTVIALMLACLCCKKGGIGFKVRAGGLGGYGCDPRGRAPWGPQRPGSGSPLASQPVPPPFGVPCGGLASRCSRSASGLCGPSTPCW